MAIESPPRRRGRRAAHSHHLALPACGLPVPMQIRRICAPTALDLIAADAPRSADSATAKMVTDTFDVVPGSNAALDPDLWDFCGDATRLGNQRPREAPDGSAEIENTDPLWRCIP